MITISYISGMEHALILHKIVKGVKAMTGTNANQKVVTIRRRDNV
jgi:hypothetical protein